MLTTRPRKTTSAERYSKQGCTPSSVVAQTHPSAVETRPVKIRQKSRNAEAFNRVNIRYHVLFAIFAALGVFCEKPVLLRAEVPQRRERCERLKQRLHKIPCLLQNI